SPNWVPSRFRSTPTFGMLNRSRSNATGSIPANQSLTSHPLSQREPSARSDVHTRQPPGPPAPDPLTGMRQPSPPCSPGVGRTSPASATPQTRAAETNPGNASRRQQCAPASTIRQSSGNAPVRYRPRLAGQRPQGRQPKLTLQMHQLSDRPSLMPTLRAGTLLSCPPNNLLYSAAFCDAFDCFTVPAGGSGSSSVHLSFRNQTSSAGVNCLVVVS